MLGGPMPPPLLLSAIGTAHSLPLGVASGSGSSAASMAAVGSRIPGVPGTLTFTLSPPSDDTGYSLFTMTNESSSSSLNGSVAKDPNLQWIQTPPVIGLNKKVIIVDASQIYDCLDLGRRIDVSWPNEHFRASGGRASWKEWIPQEGMVGNVVHYWQPNHPDHHFRSNVNRTILLVKIGERHVPIGEKGVKEYNTIGIPSTVTACTVGIVSSTVAIEEEQQKADRSCRLEMDDMQEAPQNVPTTTTSTNSSSSSSSSSGMLANERSVSRERLVTSTSGVEPEVVTVKRDEDTAAVSNVTEPSSSSASSSNESDPSHSNTENTSQDHLV
uniref:Putative secreted protein n=1 Tax=Anopheles darlingi TaxID=43151 RepID=A0A2M4DPD1_ANODA